MITRENIEKAFSERVSYLLCTFKEDDRTGLREPTTSEIKDRLLALVSPPPAQSRDFGMEDHAKGCEGRNYTCTCGYDADKEVELNRLRLSHHGE